MMRENKTLKKCQVHCLEVNINTIGILLIGKMNEFLTNIGRDKIYSNSYWRGQHLYITSDEEIKEGDWAIQTDINIVLKVANLLHDCKKIIATTNPELWREDDGLTMHSIPEDFVAAYVREQGIKEVNVEYDYIKKEVLGLETYDSMSQQVPKLRTNGTIIIHPVKEQVLYKGDMYRAWCAAGGEPGKNKFEDWFNKNYPE